MRKNSICQNGVPQQNSFDGPASRRTSGFRALRLPITCIAVGIAVLYCSERSIAALFDSGSNTSGFAVVEGFASSALQKVWQTAVASLSGDASRSVSDEPIQSPAPLAPTTSHSSIIPTASQASGNVQSTTQTGSQTPITSATSNITHGTAGILRIAPAPDAPVGTGWKGTASTAWSNASNWDNTGPAAGANDLFFGAAYNTAGGAGNTTANNDISGYGGHKIVFEATGSDHSFTITGNGFTLFDFGGASPVFPQIDNESSVLQTFNLTSGQAVAFNDTSASHKAEILANGGDITFSSTTGVDLAGTTQLQINSVAGKTVTFGGIISSSGNSGGNSFALNGNNNVIFAAANTYAGDTFVNAGKLQFAAGGSANNSTIRIGNTSGSASAEMDLLASTGGIVLSSVINPRAGTTGTLSLNSQNTSGSNGLSGHIGLDHDFTITQNTGGLLFITQARSGVTTTTGTDIKAQTLTLNGGGNIFFSGDIYNSTGSGAVAYSGTATLRLSGNNTYSKETDINSGQVALDSNNGAGTGTIFVGNGATTGTAATLSITTTGLTVSNNVSVNNGTANTRTVGGSLASAGTSTYSGTVDLTNTASGSTILNSANQGGTIAFNLVHDTGKANTVSVIGPGVVSLSGTVDNLNLGAVVGDGSANSGNLLLAKASTSLVHAVGAGLTVNGGGTVTLGGSGGDQIFNSSAMTLNGGTFKTAGLSEGSAGTTGIGALTLSANSTIDFGTSNTSVLQFAGLGTHTTNTVLSLTNWNGVPFTGGSGDRLLFAGTASSFTSQYNQADVSFNGMTGYTTDQFTGFFEVTAIPEPSTYISGAFALLVIGFKQRKRVSSGHFLQLRRFRSR